MSNYCTYSDVSALYGTTFTATSNPTSTQVTEWITQITNEIDVRLYEIGITEQPTDSTFLGILKKYCSFGAACITGMAHFHNAEKISDSRPLYYCQQYQKFLENIEIILKIAGYSNNVVSNIVLDGTKTENEIKDSFLDRDYEH